MKHTKEIPEVGEFVLATVRKIFKHGAIVSLDEYRGAEALLHVSEVAPRWIKNIHEFIKDGQKLVVLVTRVDPDKRQVDVSLKRVSESDRRKKMEEYRRQKRAQKLLEVAAKEAGADIAQFEEEVGGALERQFGALYDGLEAIAKDPRVLEKLSVRSAWKKPLREIVEKNVKKPTITISGTLKLTSKNGIGAIRAALTKIQNDTVTVTYLGAPQYKLEITDEDYPRAEKKLSKILDTLEREMKSAKGTCEFVRAET